MGVYVKKKTKPSMEEVLKSAGWKKSLEGWKDPVKGDKVTLGAAWARHLKNDSESKVNES